LYALYTHVRYAKLEEEGVSLLPKDIRKHLEMLITQARVYFAADATREILNEVSAACHVSTLDRCTR